MPTLPLQVHSGRQTKSKQHPEDLYYLVPNLPEQPLCKLRIVKLLKLRSVSVGVLDNSVAKVRQFCLPELPHFPEAFF